MCLIVGPMAQAEDLPVTGKIEWGVWVDPDGCQHWWADGGTEGYMVPRRDPKTGKAVCTKPKSCLTESTDTFCPKPLLTSRYQSTGLPTLRQNEQCAV